MVDQLLEPQTVTPPASTASVATSTIHVSQKKSPLLLILTLIALVVIVGVLFAAQKMGVKSGLRVSNESEEDIVGTTAADSNQSFVNNDVAVLTPTAAGELSFDQSNWQTVTRDGFQLKFPPQFFDEADIKHSTYYNPAVDNANYVTDEGIQVNYRFGNIGDRDFMTLVNSARIEELDEKPDGLSEVQTLNYNGVEVLLFETNGDLEKEYYYFFRLADQQRWARIQVIVHDPKEVGYTGVVQQIMNTLSLTI